MIGIGWRAWDDDAGGYPARMTATSEFIDPEILVMMEAVAYKPT